MKKQNKPTPIAQRIIAGLRARGYTPTRLQTETQLVRDAFVFIVQNEGTVLSVVKKVRTVVAV
jgi:hypothetical protein